MVRQFIISIILTIFVSCQYEIVARSPLQIINGTTAEDGEFPYMVQLQSYGNATCGGTIIGPEWILTAGHCVVDGDIDLIVYGTNTFYKHGHPNTSIKVKNWYLHPNYTLIFDGFIPIYDVGLLQLEEPIPLSDRAQPIKLAEVDANVPFHVQGVLSGWGDNATFGGTPQYLQKIYLQLLTDEECSKKINDLKNGTFFPTHNLCSDDYYNGACHGDSGGPFVINGTEYGIVSWSFTPCGYFPTAYSRITTPEYRNWIKDITNI